MSDDKVVNDKSSKRAQSEYFKKLQKYSVWLVIYFVIAALVAGGYYYSGHHKSYVFIIEGNGYTKADVNMAAEYMQKTLKKSSADAYMEVFELSKYKETAQKLGIHPREIDLQQTRHSLDITYSPAGSITDSKYKAWADLVAFKMTIDESFASSNLSGLGRDTTSSNYKGYSFIFWYGNRLDYSADYTPPGGYGNKQLIAGEKDYAQKQAQTYHDKLAKNQITPEKALQEIKKDPKLGFQYNADTNLSSHFGTEVGQSWQRQVYYQTVVDYVNQHSETGVSGVQIGKISGQIGPATPISLEEAYYYFVKIDGKVPTLNQFQDVLKNLKTKYNGVKV